MSSCILGGSFDPWHNGHEERLKNALKIFDKVYIYVANSYTKKYWFTQEERISLVKKCTKKYGKKVIVKSAKDKMIHDICHEEQIFNVFRGVKSGRTFDDEMRLQIFTNYMSDKEYKEQILFIYDITSDNDFRGSSLIKKLIIKNKSIDSLVPNEIINDVYSNKDKLLFESKENKN